MNIRSALMLAALLLLALPSAPLLADDAAFQPNAPQLPDFVYQGRLEHNGALVDGTANLVFSLWNAPSGGTQQGSTITENNYPVTRGLFSVSLAFPGAFVGEQLYLEVTVDGTTLPRQPVSTTPVAQFALQVPAAATGQSVTTVFGTGQLVVTTATTTYTLIPGLTQVVNVPANSRVIVTTDGGIQSTGATSTTYSVVDIGVFIDGVVSTTGGQRRLSIANTAALAQLIANWSMTVTRTLSAGNHTFEVRAVSGAGGSSNANVSSSSAPQLQGQLTVTIIKL